MTKTEVKQLKEKVYQTSLPSSLGLILVARKHEIPPIWGQDPVANQAANGKRKKARLRNSFPEIACFK